MDLKGIVQTKQALGQGWQLQNFLQGMYSPGFIFIGK
jgi:hypothetical protein